MILVIVLMTLMPDARVQDVIAALAGDLAVVPWARPWRPASARSAGDWRGALGPVPLEDLRDLVLGAAWREHQERGLPRRRHHREDEAAAGGVAGRDADPGAGHAREQGVLRVSRHGGRLIAVPAGQGAAGDLLLVPGAVRDAARPRRDGQGGVRAVAARRGHGPVPRPARAGLDLADGPQLPRSAPDRPPDRAHARADQAQERHPAAQDLGVLPDGSYRAELSGDGVTITVRVIEYYAEVEGQVVPEMFCLVTDLMDYEDYPGSELAGLYKWRWDGSETALREAKAPLRGAGAGHRADAPLLLPGPGGAGARGLGHRRQPDPRRHPRRRARRSAGQEGKARRAHGPAPGPVPAPAPSAWSCPRSASATTATRP